MLPLPLRNAGLEQRLLTLSETTLPHLEEQLKGAREAAAAAAEKEREAKEATEAVEKTGKRKI